MDQVLAEMSNLQPCAGIRASQYPDGGVPEGYGSVVRQAIRNEVPKDGSGCMGVFRAFDKKEASATLHVVRDEYVFRHTSCSAFAEVDSSPLRCGRCASYHARTFLKKAKEAASEQYDVNTNNSLLGTAQKVNYWLKTEYSCVDTLLISGTFVLKLFSLYFVHLSFRS